jgi:hypothetical protein
MKRARNLFALSLLLTAPIAIAACGGDDGGGDEDPTEVLEATFSADQEPVDSGVFDVSVDLAAEGGDNAGSFTASLGGPFQSGGDGVPSFDIDASIDLDSTVQDISGEAGLTSTGDAAFVSFQDTDYEVPAEAFTEFARTFTQLQSQTEAENADANGNLLSQIGVDPTNWLTNTSNEGTEDVEGTETVHISGEADVPKLVEDIQTIAENAPQAASQVTPEELSQLDQLGEIIDSAEFDIYSGTDDNVLRKFEASVDLTPPADSGANAPDNVTLDFAVTLSELNEPQEIAAPSDPQPLQGLLDQLGVDPSALGQLGGALGAADSGASPPPAGGSAGAPSGGGAADAYLQCLQQAQGADALAECEALLE